MMRRKIGILSIVLAMILLMSGCGNMTYTHNIQISSNKPNINGEDNIFEYNEDNEFDFTTAEELEKQSGLNNPDVKRYAPKWVYPFLGENVMPIGGFVEPEFDNPEYKLSVEETVKQFKESGCNLLNTQLYGTTISYTKDLLKYSDEYGVMMLVKYGGLSAVSSEKDENKGIMQMKSDLEEVSSYKSFAGLHVVDEPGYLSWVGEKAIYDKGIVRFRKIFNSKLFFINLLPLHSPAWAFPNGAASGGRDKERSKDYEYYYNSYMDNVNPQVFVYDYYPMEGAFPGMLGDYFKQLTLAKRLCEEKGIPFWCYTQLADWGGGRDVTYSEIIWQVNTGMALGAKGFMYYIFHNYLDRGTGELSHTNAPVEYDGSINRSYYDIQKVNSHIATVDEWVLNSKVKAIIQSGIMPNGEILSPELNLVKKYKHIDSTSGINHIISCMDYYKDNEYNPYKQADPEELYYVVNNTITDDGDITINFTEPVKGLYRINNKEYKFSGDKLTVKLLAGEGFALRILGEV